MNKKIVYKTGNQYLFIGGKKQFYDTKEEAFKAAQHEGSSFILECDQSGEKPKITLISWDTAVSSKENLMNQARERYGHKAMLRVYHHCRDKKLNNPPYFLLRFRHGPLLMSFCYFHAYWRINNPLEA